MGCSCRHHRIAGGGFLALALPPPDLLTAQPWWPICHLLFGLVSPLREHWPHL